MTYKFWITLFVSAYFISSNVVYGGKNECSSNPCGYCETCVVNTNIRCIKAPCPQYECHRNETCFNKSSNNIPNECTSNPCGECETCVVRKIQCKKAPCPQYECRRNESCLPTQQNDPAIIVDECASNPCVGECETCVPIHVSCFVAPCPQYECRRNDTCVNNSTDDVPKNERCSLPMDPGNCLAYMPKYFYNVKSKQCENFIYGGCGGNDNRFSTNTECERVCILGKECPMIKLPAPKKGCRYDKTPRADGCPSNDLVCDVKPGTCPASTNKTSADTCIIECSTDKNCESALKCCKIGCNTLCLSPEASNNHTSSEESGSAEERGDLPKHKNCLLPKQEGMCEMYNPKFFFNSETMECEKFVYGGCGGNSNRFSTEDECERICIAGRECPKIRHVSPPDGCRFTEGKTEDGCPMKELVCDVKPGKCPHISVNMSSDACTTECAHDGDCPHEKKCCNIECNSLCLDPKKKTKHNPGKCPMIVPNNNSVGICVSSCSNDEDCKSSERCCTNECGGKSCLKSANETICKLFCLQGTECQIIDGKAECVNKSNCIFKPLPLPPVGCHYDVETGSNGCPDYKLICNRSGNVDPCASNPCKPDERCVVLECVVAPCTGVQCLPIRATANECENNKCLPCETCVRTPLMCLRAPCQQYMCQNSCGECSVCGTNGTCEQIRTQQTVSCSNKTCENRQCHKYPDAKCVIDKCNCERHFFISSNNQVITHGECESV